MGLLIKVAYGFAVCVIVIYAMVIVWNIENNKDGPL